MRKITTLALVAALETGCRAPSSEQVDGGLDAASPEFVQVTAAQQVECGQWVAAYLKAQPKVSEDHPERLDMEAMLLDQAQETCEAYVLQHGVMPEFPSLED
jgi:hypothetical protein